MKIFLRQQIWLLAFATVLCMTSSCSRIKTNPVTWDDIAATIPSTAKYIATVNIDFEADSALSAAWGQKDLERLINVGLDLDSIRPSHIVIVGMQDVTYVTWPLPDPQRVAEKVADWPDASLNNTVDANILVEGTASLVVSSTQAWVVNSVNGESLVNDLLSAAMNTKAVSIQPFANCINSVPEAVAGVVNFNDRYYSIQLNHEDGLLRIDADAYTKRNRRMPLVDGLGRLPIQFVDSLSLTSPFAAFEVERGQMPELISTISKLSGNNKLALTSGLVSSAFDDVAGTVMAHWNTHEVTVSIPFVSEESANIAAKMLDKLIDSAKKEKHKIQIKSHGSVLGVTMKINYDLPKPDSNHKTPHQRSQTDNPSAVAFGRFDIEKNDVVDAYFELAPMHARFQVDYKESKKNLERIIDLVKGLIYRTL